MPNGSVSTFLFWKWTSLAAVSITHTVPSGNFVWTHLCNIDLIYSVGIKCVWLIHYKCCLVNIVVSECHVMTVALLWTTHEISLFLQGAVSGVLLVTPNNIMFDPHRTDPLVQECGCEEYGIMCPLEEVQSAAVYREITDSKIRESLPT